MPDSTDTPAENVKEYLIQLQKTISDAVLEIDPRVEYKQDEWRRDEGGGGESRIFENGHVFEKAGINFSDVYGDQLPDSATAARPNLAGKKFRAMGVSLVFHPVNPYVPTTHMNIRFFTTQDANDNEIWWFGGGYDLTPFYGYIEDTIDWHRAAKNACDPFGKNLYFRFKEWCDRYFYLKHRQEPRGVGGLFFDDFDELGFEQSFAFARSVGDSFLKAYRPILKRRYLHSYGARERQFQLYRRGRYAEFNMIYDRGTLFGLQSNGRTESILMSLPPLARWDYDWHPKPDSPEDELYRVFLSPNNWLKEEIPEDYKSEPGPIYAKKAIKPVIEKEKPKSASANQLPSPILANPSSSGPNLI